MKSHAKVLLAILIVFAAQEVAANPRRHFGYDRTSLGFRAGWVGAPNGFTLRRVVGNSVAFEFVAGYNGKYARRTTMPQYKKGNTFLSASFAPFFLVSEGNLGVAITGDLGARLNYHHYRYIGTDDGVAKITPEVFAGVGMQLEFSESVEIFADVHIKYFNEPHGDYVPGIESGLGVRFALH